MKPKELTEAQVDEGLRQGHKYVEAQLDYCLDTKTMQETFDSIINSEAESTQLCQALITMAGWCMHVNDKKSTILFLTAFKAFCMIRQARKYNP